MRKLCVFVIMTEIITKKKQNKAVNLKHVTSEQLLALFY